MPSRDILAFPNRVTEQKLLRPSYMNAVLIQSRGTGTRTCTKCAARPGRGPFPECRQAPGFFGGACGNCKWPDGTQGCSLYRAVSVATQDDDDDDEEEDVIVLSDDESDDEEEESDDEEGEEDDEEEELTALARRDVAVRARPRTRAAVQAARGTQGQRRPRALAQGNEVVRARGAGQVIVIKDEDSDEDGEPSVRTHGLARGNELIQMGPIVIDSDSE